MSRPRGGPPVLARWLTPPLALLLAACTAGEVPPPSAAEDSASPFADCASLTAPLTSGTARPGAGSASAGAGSASAGAGSASAGAGSAGAGGGSASAGAGAARPGAALASAGAGAAHAADASASAAAAAVSPGPAGGYAAALPDITLPCFTGGGPVRLSALRGPAVINLWGSWCDPCREELPLMQELAAATAGTLRVVGVDTMDKRDSGASFAADKGVSFPTLFDPGKQLLTALGKINLPVTVFLDADGAKHVYAGKALDKPTLGGLVRAHTGVTVTG